MDRIVQGVCDTKLKAKLLAEAGLTLTRAIELGKAAEQTYAQLKSMDNSASNADPSEIDAIGSKTVVLQLQDELEGEAVKAVEQRGMRGEEELSEEERDEDREVVIT